MVPGAAQQAPGPAARQLPAYGPQAAGTASRGGIGRPQQPSAAAARRPRKATPACCSNRVKPAGTQLQPCPRCLTPHVPPPTRAAQASRAPAWCRAPCAAAACSRAPPCTCRCVWGRLSCVHFLALLASAPAPGCHPAPCQWRSQDPPSHLLVLPLNHTRAAVLHPCPPDTGRPLTPAAARPGAPTRTASASSPASWAGSRPPTSRCVSKKI